MTGMYKPLAVTSSTNAWALAIYAGLFALSMVNLGAESDTALTQFSGAQASTILMTLLSASSASAFVTAIASGFQRDPTSSMLIEGIGLLFLAVVMHFVCQSVLNTYTLEQAPTATTLSLTVLSGCVLRLLQIAVELVRVRWIRNKPLMTTEVPAEPTKG